MRKSLLKKKIISVLSGQKLICLATIQNKKPWVRFVVSHNDELTLYVSSYLSSRKIKEIRKNPAVHVVVAKDISSFQTSYVQITARAKIRIDKSIRKKYWHPYMKKYYSGTDDPEYVVIEIKPQHIEYWESEFKQPQIFKP
ncbi:MAG: pyridoxamine 5'-phosphate oxidase family protein [Candidatus Omnitrophota bacterium]